MGSILRAPAEISSLNDATFIINEPDTSVTQYRVIISLPNNYSISDETFIDYRVIYTGIINKDNNDNFIYNPINIISNFVNTDLLIRPTTKSYLNYAFANSSETSKAVKIRFELIDTTVVDESIYYFIYQYEDIDEFIARGGTDVISSTLTNVNNNFSIDSTKRLEVHPYQTLIFNTYCHTMSHTVGYYKVSSPQSAVAPTNISINPGRFAAFEVDTAGVQTLINLFDNTFVSGYTSIQDLDVSLYLYPNILLETYYFKICTDYKYCLYYVNRNGGVDSMLFNSSSKKSVNYTRQDIERNVRKTSAYEERNSYTISNTIKNIYNLKSNWQTEASMINVEELISSSKVWLLDLSAGGIIQPVKILDNSFDYKKYKTDKMFNVTVNVESAMKNFRR